MKKLLIAIFLASLLRAAMVIAATPPRRRGFPPAASPPAASRPATRPLADYETRAASLRKTLPANFAVIVQPPFVVAGDGGAEAVQASATGTVKWAVDKLKKEYYDKDPADILDIYLFKDKPSYDKYTWELFRTIPRLPSATSPPTTKPSS